MRTRRLPQHVLVVAVLGALALAGCTQDDGPSIRADPGTTTTTAPTTSTSESPSTSSPASAPGALQPVDFGGLTFDVPADWPVHDLAADPTTCVRVDEHAIFLGAPGDSPDCPARVLGHTETLWITPLDDRRQVDAARATTATTINGLTARVDPEPDLNGALTVVFPEQQLLVVVTFGSDRPVADAILASVRRSGA